MLPGDIARAAHALAAGVGDGGGDLSGRIGVAIGDGNRRTRGGEGLGDGAADAGAGDKRNGTVELKQAFAGWARPWARSTGDALPEITGTLQLGPAMAR